RDLWECQHRACADRSRPDRRISVDGPSRRSGQWQGPLRRHPAARELEADQEQSVALRGGQALLRVCWECVWKVRRTCLKCMSCCTREAREPQASKQALGEDAHDLWQRREKVLERARADCTGYVRRVTHGEIADAIG